jgi:hypothetical protein
MPIPAASLDIQNRLMPELASGERLLWSGVPVQGMALRASDIFFVPFSLVAGGIPLFGAYRIATSINAPFPVIVFWGVPLVLLGLYLIVGRFFIDSRLRASTCYGVTDRRVIILGGLLSHQVKNLTLKSLYNISLNERPDGSGTITFGTTDPLMVLLGTLPRSWPGYDSFTAPIFERIDQARAVYNIIRETQQGAGRFGA